MKTTRVRIISPEVLPYLKDLTGDIIETKEVNPPSGKPYKMYRVNLDRNPRDKKQVYLPDSCFEIIGEIDL